MIESIKIKLLKILGRIKIYKWPFFIVYDPHTFNIKGHHYYKAKQLIVPGDILLRGYKQYLDSYFIPGKYSHAAIYLGGKTEDIIHAFTPEVQYTDLCTFMRCDSFAIIRPNVSVVDSAIALHWAIDKIGVPYDYDFIFEEEDIPGRKFSCSELIYYIFTKNHKELDYKLEEKNFIFFTKTLFTPDNCLPSDKSCAKIIYKV